MRGVFVLTALLNLVEQQRTPVERGTSTGMSTCYDGLIFLDIPLPSWKMHDARLEYGGVLKKKLFL
jgi:hypothetical protein